MKISMEIIEKAYGDMGIKTQRSYTGAGLSMIEHRVVQTESDFNAVTENRISDDNGRTWSKYTADEMYFKKDGEKEILRVVGETVPNHVTRHIIRLVMERVFLHEHKAVYKKYWSTGVMDWRDHTYIEVSRDNGKTFPKKYLLSYEKNTGIDYNHGYYGTNIEVSSDGTILTGISAPLEAVCRAYSLNANDYSLSPIITKAVMVFALVFSKANDCYEVLLLNPIIVTDEKSSRGLLEPNVILLKDGVLMVESRGSNVITEGWNTRMKKGMPSYRWLSFQDGTGKFSEPKPMAYENDEKFYSPSSISKWLRHSVNGKLYWIGNIVPEIPEGNRPRYPLCIAEFNEEKRRLIKESVMTIDDRLPGEGVLIQHSNFAFYEDRETHVMHVEYSRLGQNPEFRWQGDAVRINIKV